MKNTYKLAKTWRYLMIIPSVLLFVLFWSLFIFGGGSLDMPVGAWMLMLVVSAASLGTIYGAMASKLITSSEAIEHTSFGIQVRATWDQVEKIEFTSDGFVNLLFREPVYVNQLARALSFLYQYDKTIQLSPYTGDLATSSLLKDLAKHVPNSNIPEFVVQQKHSVKTYQEAGVIGLYYLGWFIVWITFGIIFQKRAATNLEAFGLQNADKLLVFLGFSLLIGLFINALRLLRQYNAAIIKLDESGIAHTARAYYLAPPIILLIGFMIGIGFRAFLPMRLEIYIMFLVGLVSLPVSGIIERLLFRDNTQ
jgi:hypothetical protein